MNKFKRIFATDTPIIQAPMAGSQDSELAIAVCAAGAVGSLPCAMLSPEQVRQEILKIRNCTDKAFNLNFFTHKDPKFNLRVSENWLAKLKPYYQENNLPIELIKSQLDSNSRQPFSWDMANLISTMRPQIVSFHFGLPNAELVRAVKSFGAKIMSSATTVAEAIWLEKNGADIIIAQGLEAGGHRGHFLNNDLKLQSATFKLLPAVLQAVNIPVIAAGGISSNRDLHKAIEIGAIGVQIGTAYLLSHEAKTNQAHRRALQDKTRKTALTNLFTGRPARGIYNRIMQEIGPINQQAPDFPLASGYLQSLKKCDANAGRDNFTPLWCGENRESCLELSAAEITQKLVAK